MPRILSCVAAFAFVLAACGGDDGGGSDPGAAPYIDAVVASLQEDDEGGFEVGDEVAECIATAVVDAIGVDTFEAEGLTPEDVQEAEEFSELGIEPDAETITALGESLGECELGETILAGFEDQLGEIPDADLDCIASAMDNTVLGETMAQSLVGEVEEAAAAAPVFEALRECPEAVATVFVAGIEESSGTELDEETAECIREQVALDPDPVVDLMVSSDDTGEAALTLQAALESACGELTG